MITKTQSISTGDELVRWQAKFEIGIPVIDEQHKKLVELCNNLHLAVMNKQNAPVDEWKKTFANALRECSDYVQTHFKNEETLMKAASYENFQAHKTRHDEFTKKVLETASSFNTLDRTSSLKFVHFLYDWILSHIAYEDKLYVKSVLEYYKGRL